MFVHVFDVCIMPKVFARDYKGCNSAFVYVHTYVRVYCMCYTYVRMYICAVHTVDTVCTVCILYLL